MLYTINSEGLIIERHVVTLEGSLTSHIAAALYFTGHPVMALCGANGVVTSAGGGSPLCPDCSNAEQSYRENARFDVREIVRQFNVLSESMRTVS